MINKAMKPSIIYAFDKVRKAILSSETYQQLCTANNMRTAFDKMFVTGHLAKPTDKEWFYVNELMNLYIEQGHHLK